ncbi:hypothetical protein [Chondrinema litorale]|uniref:hypothetical protein n=1 Tax=Chondrinema litorale TaxID=2994555 RepID=UPI0025429DF6|nr:hypothetical protein [Chondrinema litorale]UZR94704.1 hypothetical protein OQ292_02590 [Chondrinema litorale]
MNLIIKIVLIILFAYIAGLFLPWWIISIVCFLVVFVNGGSVAQNFLAGFLAIFILWFAHAAIIDYQNEHILSSRIAILFNLPNSFLLTLITALLGGIVGGFSSITGSLFRNLVIDNN